MLLLNDVWESLGKLPSAVIVGLCSALLALISALIGVVLTNRGNNRRLQMQLDAERELNNREREMALRTDVYLTAVEAISAGVTAVGQFANLDISFDKLTEEYRSKAPSIAKAQVIAKEPTIKAFATFNTELAATFLGLTTLRMPLTAQKQRFNLLQDEINKHLAEQSFNHTYLQYAEQCIEAVMKLGSLLIPLTLAVRKELELPINETDYRNTMEEALNMQTETFREFMREARRIAGET
jgi:hypothetical protein